MNYPEVPASILPVSAKTILGDLGKMLDEGVRQIDGASVCPIYPAEAMMSLAGGVARRKIPFSHHRAVGPQRVAARRDLPSAIRRTVARVREW